MAPATRYYNLFIFKGKIKRISTSHERSELAKQSGLKENIVLLSNYLQLQSISFASNKKPHLHQSQQSLSLVIQIIINLQS
jgi:hypothetical protein